MAHRNKWPTTVLISWLGIATGLYGDPHTGQSHRFQLHDLQQALRDRYIAIIGMICIIWMICMIQLMLEGGGRYILHDLACCSLG